jgi:hypothetical protein
MKLFYRSQSVARAAIPAEATPLQFTPTSLKKPRKISLSAEQKRLLEKPLDPRLDRILQEIYADKAAAETVLKARRIIAFPSADSGERHVIQDEHGFWRIVPGPVPTKLSEFFDVL